jgi:hypothetical protein
MSEKTLMKAAVAVKASPEEAPTSADGGDIPE